MEPDIGSRVIALSFAYARKNESRTQHARRT